MALKTVSEQQGEILVVTMTGTLDIDSALRLLKDICENAAENQLTKILVHALTVEGDLSPHERYRLGTEMARYLTERKIQVRAAFVGTPPAMNGFAARIARNRGIATGVFPGHEEALRWIHAPAPSDDDPATPAV
jgi:hypothetical protein